MVQCEGVVLHHKISTGLVAEVYACAKNKIKERLGVYRTTQHRKGKSKNSTKPC